MAVIESSDDDYDKQLTSDLIGGNRVTVNPPPSLGTMLANMGLARTRDPGGSEGRFDPSAVDPAAASFMKTRFDRREAANSNLCAWLVAETGLAQSGREAGMSRRQRRDDKS